VKQSKKNDKNFDQRLDAGEDLGDYIIEETASKSVLLNFPIEMLKALDSEAASLGVARTALIKMWLNDRLKNEKEFRVNNQTA